MFTSGPFVSQAKLFTDGELYIMSERSSPKNVSRENLSFVYSFLMRTVGLKSGAQHQQLIMEQDKSF